MKKFLLGCLLVCFACDSSEKKQHNQEKDEPKSVYIKEYIFPELSENSEKNINNWYEFKTIYQILLSISPHKQTVNILQNINPDSLYTYKRLYALSPDNQLYNTRVERDWRSGETLTDTTYRLIKNKKEDFAFLGWKELLIKDLPYVFSIRIKNTASIKNLKIEIIREKDKKVVREQFIRLDSLTFNQSESYTDIKTVKDDWVQIRMNVASPLNTTHLFSINYNDKEAENDYISFYRPELLLPIKYRSEIDNASDELLKNKIDVKSSFTSIYFWLFQLEDELKQLWTKQNFPENLNRNDIKSRLKLFETYVRELANNVKEDPSLSKEAVQNGILQIRNSFASVINMINFINEENLETKINPILPPSDSINFLNNQNKAL